jgi:hypothetical protein
MVWLFKNRTIHAQGDSATEYECCMLKPLCCMSGGVGGAAASCAPWCVYQYRTSVAEVCWHFQVAWVMALYWRCTSSA